MSRKVVTALFTFLTLNVDGHLIPPNSYSEVYKYDGQTDMVTFVAVISMRIIIICYACYTGESSLKVKIEADSNVITEHPHCDEPSIGMICCFIDHSTGLLIKDFQ